MSLPRATWGLEHCANAIRAEGAPLGNGQPGADLPGWPHRLPRSPALATEWSPCSPSARASCANPPSGVDVAFLSFTLQRRNEEGLVGHNLLESAVLLLKILHIGGSHQTDLIEEATIGRRESRF